MWQVVKIIVFLYIFKIHFNCRIILVNLDLALQPRNDHVKLHITLMNSGFSDYQSGVNSVNQSRLTFDAKKIIEVR